MSPVARAKVKRAIERLKTEGVGQTERAALVKAGHEVVYDEMRKRGLVWSVDLQDWRPTKRPRVEAENHTVLHALDRAQVRVIVSEDCVDAAIAQLIESFELQGYTVKHCNVREGRNAAEALIYMIIEG
jgi:hypothetical protein